METRILDAGYRVGGIVLYAIHLCPSESVCRYKDIFPVGYTTFGNDDAFLFELLLFVKEIL